MVSDIEFWKIAAGLGLFLYAINLAEDSLKLLSGRSFKKLLRFHTNNHFKSVLVGTFSTAILQSSSAVTLMLLVFVGSGVINFSNALGIVIGSNLGTTLTGWVVSTFGFEFDIENKVFPVIAVGTLMFIFLNKNKLLAGWGKLITAFGLLFFGLSLMKSGVASIQNAFNPEDFAGYHYLVFALFGFVFTAIIQSSSATMAITLTALNANLVTLSSAAALVVGADLGTTATVILGSLAGSSEKRQVAAAHFLFNLITDIIALAALPLLLILVIKIVGTDHPLYALVLFHSGFNLLGIILFWPFLGTFATFLQNRINGESRPNILQDMDPRHPDPAIEALRVEARSLIGDTMTLNKSVFVIPKNGLSIDGLLNSFKSVDYLTNYSNLKNKEANVIAYLIDMQSEVLSPEQAKTLQKIMAGTRSSAVAAKNIKDISHNLVEFASSSNDDVYNIFVTLVTTSQNIIRGIEKSTSDEQASFLFESLVKDLQKVGLEYQNFIEVMNKRIREDKISLNYISSLFNTNREIYSSNRALILAVGDLWLSPQQAEDLEKLS